MMTLQCHYGAEPRHDLLGPVARAGGNPQAPPMANLCLVLRLSGTNHHDAHDCSGNSEKPFVPGPGQAIPRRYRPILANTMTPSAIRSNPEAPGPGTSMKLKLDLHDVYNRVKKRSRRSVFWNRVLPDRAESMTENVASDGTRI